LLPHNSDSLLLDVRVPDLNLHGITIDCSYACKREIVISVQSRSKENIRDTAEEGKVDEETQYLDGDVRSGQIEKNGAYGRWWRRSNDLPIGTPQRMSRTPQSEALMPIPIR
jgi:hypothetical protein